MDAKRSERSGTVGMVAAFGLLLWLEHRRSLRKSVESKERRVARNLGVAGVSAALLHFAERPVSVPLARLVERRRLGLLQRLSLPSWLETLLGLLLLDYTLYLWHVLEHRVPALWRFQQRRSTWWQHCYPVPARKDKSLRDRFQEQVCRRYAAAQYFSLLQRLF